jgi:hypothetical protein
VPKFAKPKAMLMIIDMALLLVNDPIMAIRIIFNFCSFSFLTKYATMKLRIPPPTKVSIKKKPTTSRGIFCRAMACSSEAAAEKMT